VHPICLLVVEEANSTTQTACLFGKDGRFVLKPLGKTKAVASEGIFITTLSSTADEVA
jgi:hypothetical protein